MEDFNLEKLYKTYIDKYKKFNKNELYNILGFNKNILRLIPINGISFRIYKKLLENPTIDYCYTYKIEIEDKSEYRYAKSYILYSPSCKNDDDYKIIYKKFNDFLESKDRKYKKLIKKINNNENDFDLLKLPMEYFNKKIFLSTVYFKKDCNSQLKTGINIILFNQRLSRKIIYLPDCLN